MKTKYKNKAHQAVFEKGRRAALAAAVRFPPYGCDDRTTLYFRRAWLNGYDTGALELAENTMRRSDPEAVASSELPTTDHEWDRTLDVVRQVNAGADQ